MSAVPAPCAKRVPFANSAPEASAPTNAGISVRGSNGHEFVTLVVRAEPVTAESN